MSEYVAKRNPNRCPVHPGELLRDGVLPATGKTKSEIAALLGISRQHLYDIINERKPVSPSIAVRLGKLFGDGTAVWVRMQGAYDTWHAERGLADEISKNSHTQGQGGMNVLGGRPIRSPGSQIGIKMAKKLAPLHPGEVLREEFLVPLNLSAGALAKTCGLPRTRIERITAETIGISADTALRLGKALGTSAQLWMNLQNRYDVEIARRDIGKKLDRIEPIIATAGRL